MGITQTRHKSYRKTHPLGSLDHTSSSSLQEHKQSIGHVGSPLDGPIGRCFRPQRPLRTAISRCAGLIIVGKQDFMPISKHRNATHDKKQKRAKEVGHSSSSICPSFSESQRSPLIFSWTCQISKNGTGGANPNQERRTKEAGDEYEMEKLVQFAGYKKLLQATCDQ